MVCVWVPGNTRRAILWRWRRDMWPESVWEYTTHDRSRGRRIFNPAHRPPADCSPLSASNREQIADVRSPHGLPLCLRPAREMGFDLTGWEMLVMQSALCDWSCYLVTSTYCKWLNKIPEFESAFKINSLLYLKKLNKNWISEYSDWAEQNVRKRNPFHTLDCRALGEFRTSLRGLSP